MSGYITTKQELERKHQQKKIAKDLVPGDKFRQAGCGVIFTVVSIQQTIHSFRSSPGLPLYKDRKTITVNNHFGGRNIFLENQVVFIEE